MDQLTNSATNLVSETKQNFFALIGNYLEKGYKFVRIKQPRTAEEEKFLQSYQNMFLWQSMALILLATSGIYLFRLSYYGRKQYEKGLKGLIIKTSVFAGCGFICNYMAMSINSKEKILEKTDRYGQEFINLAKSLQPQDLII